MLGKRTTTTTTITVAAVALLAANAAAQTIDQIRDAVREAAGRSRQTAFMAAFLDLSEDTDIAAGSLQVDGEPEFDVKTLRLPWRRDIGLGHDAPELRVEAGAGYIWSQGVVADIWSGSLPGSETEVRARYQGVSAFLGAGPRFLLHDDVHFSLLGNASLAYLWNDADYAGPGTAVTSSILDGILFNWNLAAATYGAAAVLEHELATGAATKLQSQLRYDIRRIDVLRSTDGAQNDEDTIERAMARTELGGPLGVDVFSHALDWSSHVTYSRFLGDNRLALGFLDWWEIGGDLSASLGDDGALSRLSLSAAVIVGEDVHGWSFGVGASF